MTTQLVSEVKRSVKSKFELDRTFKKKAYNSCLLVKLTTSYYKCRGLTVPFFKASMTSSFFKGETVT